MMEVLIKIVASYLIGSLSGSLIVGKFRRVDIRTMGSGNAGGTNAFRTQGLLFALGVVIIDVAKGYIPTKFISQLTWMDPSSISPDLLPILCGFSAVLGHVYPVYHRFRGGKGGGAGIGMILVLHPFSLVVVLIIWIMNLLLTGWVGLGTMLAACSIPIFSYFCPPSNPYFFLMSVILALFIIYTHRSNIRRMLAGNENRFEKVMVFRRR